MAALWFGVFPRVEAYMPWESGQITTGSGDGSGGGGGAGGGGGGAGGPGVGPTDNVSAPPPGVIPYDTQSNNPELREVCVDLISQDASAAEGP